MNCGNVWPPFICSQWVRVGVFFPLSFLSVFFFFSFKYSVIASRIVIHHDGNKGGEIWGGGSRGSYNAVKPKNFGCTTSAILFVFAVGRLWNWADAVGCWFATFRSSEVGFKVSETVATPIISWTLLLKIRPNVTKCTLEPFKQKTQLFFLYRQPVRFSLFATSFGCPLLAKQYITRFWYFCCLCLIFFKVHHFIMRCFALTTPVPSTTKTAWYVTAPATGLACTLHPQSMIHAKRRRRKASHQYFTSHFQIYSGSHVDVGSTVWE